MEDRISELLEHYTFEADTLLRARGAMLAVTNDGYRLICACKYKEQRIEFEDFVKNTAKNNGFEYTDIFVRNKAGELITKTSQQEAYVVKEWFDAAEISIKSEAAVIDGVKVLANLHKALRAENTDDTKENITLQPFKIQTRLNDIFVKHLKEMKRVRIYVKEKRTKNEFETEYINMCDEFMEEAKTAINRLTQTNYDGLYDRALRNRTICHGDYNYHNILALNRVKNAYAVVNFEKAVFGIQCLDFYQYLRKIMEKNDWNIELGRCMIDTYINAVGAGEEEVELLGILVCFPEKFWKLTNFYYNSKKSWIPQKNLKKLTALRQQQEKKTLFLEKTLGW